jgi:hypothetical protein
MVNNTAGAKRARPLLAPPGAFLYNFPGKRSIPRPIPYQQNQQTHHPTRRSLRPASARRKEEQQWSLAESR